MGIRIKLALGFALLTVVIISSVSFWAAQSLGFSIESSDIDKLELLQKKLVSFLDREQSKLDLTCNELATAFNNLKMHAKPFAEQQKFFDALKISLGLDWLEIFANQKPVLNENSILPQNVPGQLQKLAYSGPYSYQGYLTSTKELSPGNHLVIAQRPDFSSIDIPVFCFFNQLGMIEKGSFNGDFKLLQRLAKENISGELKKDGDLFRIRVFKMKPDYYILTGYLAQRTMISRPDIDKLMIRLTVLQVLGLLLLGYFLGSKLFGPLQALRNGIEKVAQGDWKEIPLDQPPMLNSGNEIETVAQSFNRMVKELSSAQNRLIEVQKELAKKDKLAALGRFSAGIAHEINNPLGTILANAGLLKESLEKGCEISQEEVEEIISEVKRCKNIIETLRTYTSQTRPRLNGCDFVAAFKELLGFVQSKPEFISMTIKTDCQAQGKVKIDIEAMKQVFYNLTRNAAEAMSSLNYKELTIFAENGQDHLSIVFSDCGEGFACEPELIFEPLFTTKAQGTGLGLIICQAIIEGHGGRISAGRNGNRTEFKIELPCQIENKASGEDDEK